jgi:hypothetical protein
MPLSHNAPPYPMRFNMNLICILKFDSKEKFLAYIRFPDFSRACGTLFDLCKYISEQLNIVAIYPVVILYGALKWTIVCRLVPILLCPRRACAALEFPSCFLQTLLKTLLIILEIFKIA